MAKLKGYGTSTALNSGETKNSSVGPFHNAQHIMQAE